MNKVAFINFLVHLFFFCVIMQLVGSILHIIKIEACRTEFISAYLLPISYKRSVVTAVTLTLDTIFALIVSWGHIGAALGLFGFIAAVCLKINPRFSFAVSMSYMCYVVSNVISNFCYNRVRTTLEKLIQKEITRLFNEVNNLDRSFWLSTKRYMKKNAFIYEKGWSTAIQPKYSSNHSVVDFIQITSKCCGLSGRAYWEIPVPKSCCQSFVNCSLMSAYSQSCMSAFNTFATCVSHLKLENVVLGILAFATGALGFYLTYHEVKYSDGNYESEPEYKSSDDDS